MDYGELAFELIKGMKALHKIKTHRSINDALQGEAFVLDCIALGDGDVLPGEIGQEMNVSSARVAAALNSLEKKGLITRRIDTNDRRKILIGITPEGKKLAETHQSAVLGLAAKMLELLGDPDATEYVRIMKKLTTLLPEYKEQT
ncbi:MAG: MarR family transcriptional regulator [Oscillospiraceae bacterium]|nr:MarR family transcriptional regulator [Oscillospiraceae bacterium]